MSLKDLLSPFYVWQRAFEKPYTSIKPIPGTPRFGGLSRLPYQSQRGMHRLRHLPQDLPE